MRQLLAVAEGRTSQLQREMKFAAVGTYRAFDVEDETLNTCSERLLDKGVVGLEEAMLWKS